jgi:hypothetical protein
MKTITKTASATTEKGTILSMVVTASRGWEKVKETIYSDGWNTEVETMKETNTTEITITAQGREFKGHFNTGVLVPADYRKQGVFATFSFGNGALGLSERVYNELNTVVEAAKAEAEADENWMKLQAKKAQAQKEVEEYDRHVKAVENMMTLNGRTY